MSPIPPLMTRRTHAPATLCRARQGGLIESVLPGVYLRADLAADLRWRLRAVQAWNPQAVVLGEAAAARTFWPQVQPTGIDVAARTGITRPGFRFSDRSIPLGLRTRVDGVPMTAPALTALDLVPRLGGEAIDRALRSRRVRIDDLQAALAATSGRAGNAERRRALLDSRAEPWSAAERIAHRLLRAEGIRGWRSNVPVTLGGCLYFLDIAFVAVRLAIEIDGRAFHSAASAFEQDRERQNTLVLAGWTVLRFTYRMLTEEPAVVAALIRRALAGVHR